MTARAQAYAGTLRAADVRLLTPAPSRRVRVIGAPLAAALRAAGHELVEADADVVIAGAGRGREAATDGAPTVILLGGRAGALRRAGYRTRTFVIRRGAQAPRLYVPVDSAPAVRAALLGPAQGRGTLKRVAVRVAVTAVRAGLPVVDTVTVATRGTPLPELLAGAEAAAGIAIGEDWYLLTGDGDDLQRGVWFCLGEPGWVVKFSRVAGNTAPFDREVAAVGALPPALAARAPSVAARFTAGGLPATVETVGRGSRLQDLLEEGRAPSALVGSIADWVAALGAATQSDGLEAELQRLEADVLPAWPAAPPDLVRRLPRVPAVLQHNDLGTWNVVAQGADFTVLDWESSRPAGLPLWDLAYFLTDALLDRRGPEPAAVKAAAALRLLRGETPASRELFARLRGAAEALGIPVDAVGPIVTLGWLHHGLSARARAERGGSPVAAASVGVLERLAEPWLADPQLGVDWPALTHA